MQASRLWGQPPARDGWPIENRKSITIVFSPPEITIVFVANEAIVIDGSQGEGGGQILRTSVALAAALGKSVRVVNIRSNRRPGGLRPQHLSAVQAVARICHARVSGDQVDSREILFEPGPVESGEYRFDIGTAGSTSLVAQTLLPPLALSGGDSRITVTGGTHNPWAPCFEYLRDVFGLLVTASNIEVYFELERAGFYPAGGGRLRIDVGALEGWDEMDPFRYAERGQLRYIEGVSAVSTRLPAHIAERQASQALGRLAAAGHAATIEQTALESDSPGTVLFLRAVFGRSTAGFFALGQRGKPAEEVADEAVDQLLDFLDGAGAVDEHAADQLITLAALCPLQTAFTTRRPTGHLWTNAQVIRQLTGRDTRIEGPPDGPARVVLEEAQ